MDYEAIMTKLYASAEHKKDIELAKKKAECDAILKAYEAYTDGVYDTVKAIRELDNETGRENL